MAMTIEHRHDWKPDTYLTEDGWEPTGDLTCATCGADGYPCQECEGTGFVTVTIDRLTDEEDEFPCQECGNTGVIVVTTSAPAAGNVPIEVSPSTP